MCVFRPRLNNNDDNSYTFAKINSIQSQQSKVVHWFKIHFSKYFFTYNHFRVQEVLGGDRDVEKTDLSQLVYLEAVLKESMRVFTIVPVLARKLDRDVKLSELN